MPRTLPTRPLSRPRRRFQALVVAGIATVAFAAPAVLSPSPAAAFPTTGLTLMGHGYGHGIGMGQWGSLGYALGQDAGAGNFTYSQILEHYYGNTTLDTLGTAPAPQSLHGGNVLVAMTQNNGGSLIALAASGAVNVPGGTTAAAVEMLPNAGNTSFSIYTGPGCAGPWTGPVGAPVATATTAAQNGGPMELCEVGGNIELHGTLTALFNTTPSSRVVNTLPLEQYVADVAPAESPSSWSLLGGAGPQTMDWGFQQSEAQTVAARSYVESNPMGYGGYADTCDQTCQSYPGMKFETLSSVAAALDTAGQVMVTNGTSSVAVTEYSSSSGGYTTGDQFPAVVDAGDAICIPNSVCNTNHSWTATLSVAAIDAAYPQIGTLSSFNVTSRDGNGDFGGRVNMLTLTGSSGSVSVTGASFAGTFNLLSNWFTLGGQPSGGVGGYWADASNGAVFTFGGATYYGSAGALSLNKPVVGMAATADDAGYWLVATDGGIFSYGDAVFHGSTGGMTLNEPVVGMAATPDGKGYWLVATDGGIFSFGDAVFHGSTGAIKLNKPIVGMVPTHDGGGYWLMASDGGVFAFGDATFHGSLGGNPPSSPVVDVAPTPDGGGYWMLEANGTVVPFGDAALETPTGESPAVSAATGPMTSIMPTTTGQGYLLVDSTGQVFSFGDAPYFGDVASTVPGYSGAVVGIATTPG
jgi:SpoIID/LytB domain protein